MSSVCCFAVISWLGLHRVLNYLVDLLHIYCAHYRSRTTLDAPVTLPPWNPASATIDPAAELAALSALLGTAAPPQARVVQQQTPPHSQPQATAPSVVEAAAAGEAEVPAGEVAATVTVATEGEGEGGELASGEGSDS